jgi:hypothetical protein
MDQERAEIEDSSMQGKRKYYYKKHDGWSPISKLPGDIIEKFVNLKSALSFEKNTKVVEWLFSQCNKEIDHVIQVGKENVSPQFC